MTTDLCDADDLVCDSTHVFSDILLPPADAPWKPPLGIKGAVERGTKIHSESYTPERLSALAQPAVKRAVSFAVPLQVTSTILSCNIGGDIAGAASIKRLDVSVERSQRWTLKHIGLHDQLLGAKVTDHGLTKGSFVLFLDDRGGLSGTLPAGRWELDVAVTTGLDSGRTLHLIVEVVTAGRCGAVNGFATDRDGEALDDVEVWLETSTDDWDGETSRRVAVDRTDSEGYFSISGSLSGDYLLFFTDGPGAESAEEAALDERGDLFDQYYLTGKTSAYSDQPGSGSLVTVSAGVTRADQILQPSSSIQLKIYDVSTSIALEGISATGTGWTGTSGSEGLLWDQGRYSYDGCMSIYDPARVYVERARYYLGWPGEEIVRMYRGSSISGTVTNAAGEPVADAMVFYSRDDLPNTRLTNFGGGSGCYSDMGLYESGRAFTDKDGKYRFGALYGGDNYRVSTEIDDESLYSDTFSLTTAYYGFEDVTVDLGSELLPLTAATPTISGTAKVGLTLTARPGAWTSGSTFDYQWLVNNEEVFGATKSTFALRSGDKGKNISVRVTGKKMGYGTATKTSKATAKVVAVSVLSTATPTISGSATVGSRLNAKAGKWTAGTKFSYQWLINGKLVSGATKSNFTVRSAHKGKKVSVKVTGSQAGYGTVSKTSKATAKVKK